MTDVVPKLAILAASTLGGPGPPDPQKCSESAMEAMAEAAGPEMRLASLSLDVTSHPLGAGQVEVAVRVDKRARSIVFVSAEARLEGRLVYSAQGLFSRAA